MRIGRDFASRNDFLMESIGKHLVLENVSVEVRPVKFDRRRYKHAIAGVLAGIAFLLSGALFYYAIRPWEHLSLDIAEWYLDKGYPRVCLVPALRMADGVAWLPSLGIALYVFFRRSSKMFADKHTRCAKCDYILNGLGGLRCPECGQEV